MSGLRDEKILGLTVRSPAAELIARGIKTIENRGWPPHEWMLGRYLAIHASPMWDQEWADFVRRNLGRFAVEPPLVGECRYGVIAVARLVGWVRRVESASVPGAPWTAEPVKMLDGHAFGAAEDPHGHSIDWRWFQPQIFEYGWVLRDVRRITPVACKGRQGVWKLPPLVYSSVRRAYERAAA